MYWKYATVNDNDDDNDDDDDVVKQSCQTNKQRKEFKSLLPYIN